MTIDELITTHLVEDIVDNVAKKRTENENDLKDLIQDVYVNIIEKWDRLEHMTQQEWKYYISRVVMNNICSTTSPYFKYYKKPKIGNVDVLTFINYEEKQNEVKDVE